MKAITIKKEMTFRIVKFKGFGIGVVKEKDDYPQKVNITYHIMILWFVFEISTMKYKKVKGDL